MADTLLKFGPVEGEGSVRLTSDRLDSLINFKIPALDTLEVAIGPQDGTPWGLRFYSTGVPGFDNPLAVDFPFIGGGLADVPCNKFSKPAAAGDGVPG